MNTQKTIFLSICTIDFDENSLSEIFTMKKWNQKTFGDIRFYGPSNVILKQYFVLPPVIAISSFGPLEYELQKSQTMTAFH